MIIRISTDKARKFFEGGGQFRRILDDASGRGFNAKSETVSVSPRATFFEWNNGEEKGRCYYGDAAKIELIDETRVAFHYNGFIICYERAQ